MTEPAKVAPLVDRPHVLYRMYDSAKRLLYVGITFDAALRWRAHSEEKSWWKDVASVDVQHFRGRESAERAEKAAIRSERPKYNIVHRVQPVPGRKTGSPMRHRNIRMDDQLWFSACRIAELNGETISDVMRRLIRTYVARHRHLLDDDPVWQRMREAGEVEE